MTEISWRRLQPIPPGEIRPKLFEVLREHWRRHKPKESLFPGSQKHTANYPFNSKVVWHACHEAAKRAGPEKKVYAHTSASM